MKVIFSELAKMELDDACSFYDLQVSGLGSKFKEEVGKAARRIAEFPAAWSIERGEIRKGLLHMFPYKLLYSIEKAIFSLSRWLISIVDRRIGRGDEIEIRG